MRDSPLIYCDANRSVAETKSMQLQHYKRAHEREYDEEPYCWINREWGVGRHAHIIVWIERCVSGYDQQKWTVRKEQFDDDSRGQHKPTNLSDHATKEAARKAAVEWMKNH